MLITRTPLRISIGGGGTDLPSYYEEHGGFLLTGAIDKHIFIGLNRIFTRDYVIKYSEQERVDTIDEIRHPIIREVLRLHDIQPSTELVSLADIPAGTGLGSSGSFTVGLLRAIHGLKRHYISPEKLAEEACRVEIDLLEQSVGKQDQYVAAVGGLISMEIAKDGAVTVEPLRVRRELIDHLDQHLIMFFTGYSRQAVSLLSDQHERTKQGDQSMIDQMHRVKESGYAIKDALESGKPETFADLMHEHWLRKRARSQGMSNPCIDRWYEAARNSGARGGKLIGAGGGGFLLFYAEKPRLVRAAMTAEGLEEVRFRFDHDGSIITMRDGA